MDKEEIPAALPKQFSESLKRIGEQAKEWQTKKLDHSQEEATGGQAATKTKTSTPAAATAPVQATAATITATKPQFNWSATSLVVTLFVLVALVMQTVWLRSSIESLSIANKDLQIQVEGLTQELRTMQETVKAQAQAQAAPVVPAPDATATPAPTEVPAPGAQQNK
jgi:hypothetical protein